MRIISGTARSRKLKEPAGNKIRPTSDMAKETMFNIIQFDIEGRRVLDLFAGTGQLGIEALSRGAESVVFVDESTEAVSLVRENLKITGFEENAKVYRDDAVSFLKRGGKFDIIFIDPPYDTKILDKVMGKIIEFDILKENGIIICESNYEKPMPDVPEPYKKRKEYKCGRTKITLYSKTAD